jgi:hypothetical protein
VGGLHNKKAKEPREGRKEARGKKDKNAPKKGMSAYMFFLNSLREQVSNTPRYNLAFSRTV